LTIVFDVLASALDGSYEKYVLRNILKYMEKPRR